MHISFSGTRHVVITVVVAPLIVLNGFAMRYAEGVQVSFNMNHDVNART